MPRVYTKKGANKLSINIAVPLTPASVAALEQRAQERKVTKTELARTYILTGLVAS